MPEQRDVRIIAWPEEPAKLDHGFREPVPIDFRTPAKVVLHTADQPVRVDMAMNVIAKQVVPVCIKVCEPICVVSEYGIAIEVFDRPVATIRLKGETRIFNCQERPKE